MGEMKPPQVATERVGWLLLHRPAPVWSRVARVLYRVDSRAGTRGHRDERRARGARRGPLDARRAVVYVLVLVHRAKGRVQHVRRLERAVALVAGEHHGHGRGRGSLPRSGRRRRAAAGERQLPPGVLANLDRFARVCAQRQLVRGAIVAPDDPAAFAAGERHPRADCAGLFPPRPSFSQSRLVECLRGISRWRR
eukprot:scaffold78591_cov63-Phaeocystis_antarctica.AAC.3